jgi:hypothetical protein
MAAVASPCSPICRRSSSAPRRPEPPARVQDPREIKTPGRASRMAVRRASAVARARRAGAHSSSSAGCEAGLTGNQAGQGRSARGSGVCRVFAGRRLAARQPRPEGGPATASDRTAGAENRGRCAGGMAG